METGNKIFCYRYVFKTKDNEKALGVRYVTDTLEGLAALDKSILKDDNILSCMREYINEVDLEKSTYCEPVKVDVSVPVEEDKEVETV
ncbi:hypothetical protein [Sigmofec virus UA08Rod_6219]|uniref:Uncharacterized protein n=1 Tax=Sigmofec virus UA08Rod_6219 TaxID=2929225 RepID=A0A976N0N1_9VIRU|nr:hypothetical protein [Sigmofec virus UA08Rod_6219]